MRKPLEGPEVWSGAELEAARDWRFRLTAPMLAEIDAALAGVERRGIAWEAMQRADFPLPQTAPLLAKIARRLEEGRGLAKLSGLPVERYDAVLELELQIRNDAGAVRAQTVARATHTRFLMDDYRDYERERVIQLQRLTDEVIAAALKRLEIELRANMSEWVR